MIAWDTDYCWVDEELFFQNDPRLFRLLLSECSQFVVQCPGFLSTIEEYSASDTAIVVVRRDVEAIRKSMERIGSRALRGDWLWTNYPQYQMRYPEVAYYHWDNVQREQVENAFEIRYESLAKHQLWVGPEQRRSYWKWNSRCVARNDRELKRLLSCPWAMRAAI